MAKEKGSFFSRKKIIPEIEGIGDFIPEHKQTKQENNKSLNTKSNLDTNLQDDKTIKSKDAKVLKAESDLNTNVEVVKSQSEKVNKALSEERDIELKSKKDLELREEEDMNKSDEREMETETEEEEEVKSKKERGKKKEDKEREVYYCPKKLHDTLLFYSYKKRMKKTDIVTQALEEFLSEKVFEKEKVRIASKVEINETMLSQYLASFFLC